MPSHTKFHKNKSTTIQTVLQHDGTNDIVCQQHDPASQQ